MKVFFFFLFLCLMSCNKEMQNITTSPSNLTLSSQIKKMIPNEYKIARYAYFKNGKNDLKKMDIKYLESKEKKNHEGKEYWAEQITVQLVEEGVNSYVISVQIGSNHVANSTSGYAFLNAMIMASANNGIIPMINIDENGKVTWGTIFDTLELSSKKFEKVAQSQFLGEVKSFSNLYYTIKEGVVGFNDINNDLWVLDRIE